LADLGLPQSIERIQIALAEQGHDLKDPLIFRQCIHLRDVAVLLNRGSYVEQYD
jgi:hypothetical protein